MAKIEMPQYEVVQTFKSIEVRQYAPRIVAEVEVEGKREVAINTGFRILAGYIFGKNLPKRSIAMTSPVLQQKGVPIAMTSPVTQLKDGHFWKVQFTMPCAYTLDTLPRPDNPKVKLKSIPGYRSAAIRFSGCWNDRNLQKFSKVLCAFIKNNNFSIKGEAVYAFYNPPWTLPFFRRNEVIYILKDQ